MSFTKFSCCVLLLAIFGQAQTTLDQPPGPNTYTPTPTLASSYYIAPSVTPNILDPTAQDAQKVCPGYKASNVQQTGNRLTADLTLAGNACNVYGNDIIDLVLDVQYQNANQMNVRIFPRYIAPQNHSWYILDDFLSPVGIAEPGSTSNNSDLVFEWTNEPSFQFKVSRAAGGDPLFDTYGNVIVYEDQFLELATSMVPDYNIYGLPESIRGGFRIGTEYTQTFWNQYNVMNDNPLDTNMHSVHPVYLETRYGQSSSQSHIVYGRNLHGQEWLMRPDNLTYRAIGGSFDFYFLSGPTPNEALQQYQTGIIKTPVMQPYWALGFHQVRWGYQNWSVLTSILDGYAAANIPLEAIWNDLDYLFQFRDFTNDENTYPIAEGKEFLARLHANGQYWVPIVDPNIYVPDPTNASDSYEPYERGAELQAFIRDGVGGGFYYGNQWPGFSVWPDFLVPSGHKFWTESFLDWYSQGLEFDGVWLDLSDLSSWCTGSCGTGQLDLQPIHVPFPLPGEPGEINYMYPVGFDVSNASEAMSASAASASQASMYPTPTNTVGPVVPFTAPTPGVRNITFPPYALNLTLPGHSLVKAAVSPDATHNDEYNTTEYEMHNLFGIQSSNATYNALVAVYPERRPMLISRSTSPGSGNITGHWGGDSNSDFGNMYMTIAQALTFSIAGVPYFGVETAGFNGNVDADLLCRWMELASFYPLYRNHNSRNTIAQEAFRFSSSAEATRRAMYVRFRLLAYQYTLFWRANQHGETVLRALAWEFPDEEGLKAISNQFMLGPSILVTPVLEPNVDTVRGVFPGVGSGTRWYDWYTLDEVQVAPGENKTLDAPLVHIPVFIRGGTVIASQLPGNTTKMTRSNPWSLIIALDQSSTASGSLYLDDGISLVQTATKNIEFSFSNSTLSAAISGNFADKNLLANITITGWNSQRSCQGISITIGGKAINTGAISIEQRSATLQIQGLEQVTGGGIWDQGNLVIKFSADQQGRNGGHHHSWPGGNGGA
ncbi:glycoside hydrolase family 31 protein [Polychaeton citri CBS 116435]|uniref:alpha-glucosidase n=1 Tax=Polychaeton citri CBS 116435 TaxID=1314669 RepID=A0A9P4QES8_9PEZI|nr:glycoside hydrolase family 31 protein [Polychaeton citri CBS 116435]